MPTVLFNAPMVPPAPVMVPLVREVAAAILPVTFRVPLVTSMLSFVVAPEVESALRVRVPTPSNLNEPGLVEFKLMGLAKVLAAEVEFKINWVLSLILMEEIPEPILNAPPDTIVPAKLALVDGPPVMVAPPGKEVVPCIITLPVFKKTGAPEITAVLPLIKLTLYGSVVVVRLLLMTVFPLKIMLPVVSLIVTLAEFKSKKTEFDEFTTARLLRGVNPPIAVLLLATIFPVVSKVRFCAPLVLPKLIFPA